MGTSDPVQRLEDKTPELVGVIQTQMKAMDDTMGSVSTAFGPFVDSFYTPNKWDRQLLGQELRHDTEQESSFSLDQITAAITTMADSILAGSLAGLVGGDTSPGSKATASVEAVSTSLAADTAAGPLMISAAVACVSSVMGLFSSRAMTRVGYGMESHRVAPGLTLHAYSYSATVDAANIVEEDSIVMSSIGYMLIYSFAQAEVEQGMALMAYYTAQLAALESALEKRQAEIDAMISNPKTTMDELTQAQAFMALASTQLDDYKAKADALAKQYAPPSGS